MGKKTLGGLDALLGKEAGAEGNGARKQGRPRKYGELNSLPEDEDRASIIVKTETWNKFKALVYWERRKQKGLLDDILREYLERWEKKHGPIKPIPEDADI